MPFFKRKKQEQQPKTEEQQTVKKEHLLEEIETYQNRLANGDNEDSVPLFNMLGSLYFELEDYDQAIHFYEQSIEQKKAIGKAFTDLVKLYNVKRKQASNAKDHQAVQYYLQKSDELMKLTKDSIRENM
ncbi:Tetratricopeptide repeat-containing protein [Amphibacillus marinus]|uniref:Tetratricopeptide repeat-containing protein n=1 Tax=Amphibacillus marinus TaxID=872970 RepID=A0A1H8TB12_9BACI|nr:tetratricopeptide repeat protein [Amphibacillus marinus]SEO87683.1 Tetratricopeptide repeat-containing protein [Amphibacillus marinus]